jgi:PIN domain nuclease of toxin-antitoxin system
LEYLYEIGRTKLPSRDVQFILAAESTIRVCDFSFPAIAKTATFEKWTRDPFDRIIVANAKANGMAFLISSDEHIAKHYPRTIW